MWCECVVFRNFISHSESVQCRTAEWRQHRDAVDRPTEQKIVMEIDLRPNCEKLSLTAQCVAVRTQGTTRERQNEGETGEGRWGKNVHGFWSGEFRLCYQALVCCSAFRCGLLLAISGCASCRVQALLLYIALWLWSTKHTVNWKFDYQSNCFGTTTLSVNQNNILIISSHRVLGLFSLTQIAALLLTLWLVNRMHIRVDWYSNGGF